MWWRSLECQVGVAAQKGEQMQRKFLDSLFLDVEQNQTALPGSGRAQRTPVPRSRPPHTRFLILIMWRGRETVVATWPTRPGSPAPSRTRRPMSRAARRPSWLFLMLSTIPCSALRLAEGQGTITTIGLRTAFSATTLESAGVPRIWHCSDLTRPGQIVTIMRIGGKLLW